MSPPTAPTVAGFHKKVLLVKDAYQSPRSIVHAHLSRGVSFSPHFQRELYVYQQSVDDLYSVPGAKKSRQQTAGTASFPLPI